MTAKEFINKILSLGGKRPTIALKDKNGVLYQVGEIEERFIGGKKMYIINEGEKIEYQ